MVGHPQRDFRDPCRELVDLDSEELVNIEPRQLGRIGAFAARHSRPEIAFLDDLALDLAQLAIGNDEEIACAACRVEEGQPGKLVVKPRERIVLAGPQRLCAGKIGLQLVQE